MHCTVHSTLHSTVHYIVHYLVHYTWQILHELLSVGVSVLLSDVDIVVTSNPFRALYRSTKPKLTQVR